MKLSYKNRLTLYYMMAISIILAVVFTTVFILVRNAVLSNVDETLQLEAREHAEEVVIVNDSVQFMNKQEWEELEHTQVQVNPVFIQLSDVNGLVRDRSPNLKSENLEFVGTESLKPVSLKMGKTAIRQVAIPVTHKGEIRGYVFAAMSSTAAEALINWMQTVLIVSFIVVLFALYFISRFLAGRSIRPIAEMALATQDISIKTLTKRLPVPENTDEVHELSVRFNNLLDRLEQAMKREKQFTSDASHELRTPLASIRGTLEVLIRRPRTQEHYEERVRFCLEEIDRMSNTVQRLLQLARLDSINSEDKELKSVSKPIQALVDDAVRKYKDKAEKYEVRLVVVNELTKSFDCQESQTRLILDNILSNAIKYSHKGGTVQITLSDSDGQLICTITDTGIGVPEKDLPQIFEHFYRADPHGHKEVTGHGLGLSIAQKAAEAIGARLYVKSEVDKGTTVTIQF